MPGRKIVATGVVLIVSALGCGNARVSWLKPYYDNSFSQFRPLSGEKAKQSSLKREYPYPYDNVFDGALLILQQYAIIGNASRESGGISYIDIDALLINDNFWNYDFPFTVFLEKNPQGTMVYVQPMGPLFDEKAGSKSAVEEKFPDVIRSGFKQKGEEFLERISVQLTASNRWPWLTGK